MCVFADLHSIWRTSGILIANLIVLAHAYHFHSSDVTSKVKTDRSAHNTLTHTHSQRQCGPNFNTYALDSFIDGVLLLRHLTVDHATWLFHHVAVDVFSLSPGDLTVIV